MFYTKFKAISCKIVLVGDEQGIKIVHLERHDGKRKLEFSNKWIQNNDFFVNETRQIREFFCGTRKGFDIKINIEGSEFQNRVWSALKEIPYGETRTYKDIAEAVGNISASRAVGTAIGMNPIPIIIPCHRVITSNGKLGGFAFGTDIKELLLNIEGKKN